MKRRAVLLVLVLFAAAVSGALAAEDRVSDGLREALQVGATNAVSRTGRVDGYFKNKAIKILLPKQLQSAESVLRTVGAGKQLDEFVLSMNRAAEKAAPEAGGIFSGAIKEITFDDARKLVRGGDTSITEFFQRKTSSKLTEAFRPIIHHSMEDVGVIKQYKRLAKQAEPLSALGGEKLDLDDYVTSKAMSGLFTVLGEEERNIRRNPAARVTSLLREVFGR